MDMAIALADAESEARIEIEEREAYFRADDPIRLYRNRLVVMLNEIKRVEGDQGSLDARAALEPLIEQCDRKRFDLNERYRLRAFDEDTIKTATRRRLMLRGVKPNQLGRWMRPDLAFDQTPSKKTEMQEERTAYVAYLERNLAEHERMFELAERGLPVFSPGNRFPTPADLTREIEKIRAALELTKPRKYTRKRKVSRR